MRAWYSLVAEDTVGPATFFGAVARCQTNNINNSINTESIDPFVLIESFFIDKS
jgi:hypothetical protein